MKLDKKALISSVLFAITAAGCDDASSKRNKTQQPVSEASLDGRAEIDETGFSLALPEISKQADDYVMIIRRISGEEVFKKHGAYGAGLELPVTGLPPGKYQIKMQIRFNQVPIYEGSEEVVVAAGSKTIVELQLKEVGSGATIVVKPILPSHSKSDICLENYACPQHFAPATCTVKLFEQSDDVNTTRYKTFSLDGPNSCVASVSLIKRICDLGMAHLLPKSSADFKPDCTPTTPDPQPIEPPVQYPMPTAKCGINTWSVGNYCDGMKGFSSVSFTCHDGFSQVVADRGCQESDYWDRLAVGVCKNRCTP